MRLTLAQQDLYLYRGMDRPQPISIYQFYEMADHPKPLVLTLQEDFEFCETLDLMFGKSPRRVPIWEWHDEFWDQLHDRRGLRSTEQLLAGIVSDRYDLARLARYPQEFDKIQRMEMERRERLKQPPIYFTGKMEFF